MDQTKSLLYAIIAGSAFALWPTIASKSKLPAGWLILIVGICLVITGMLKIGTSSKEEQVIPTLHLMGIVFAAGVINSIGYWVYGPLVMASQPLGTTFYLALTVAVSVIVFYLYSLFFLKEEVQISNIIGCLMVICGFFFIKMK
jgi:drug/metabolite transporter (DMT)-like permease